MVQLCRNLTHHSEAQNEGGAVQYDEQATGHQVDGKLHDEFEIVLAEVRTAGYRWNVVTNGEPQLQLLQDESHPSAGRVGGAGKHRWRFRAVALGECEIKLRYARSWDESGEPARTFSLKVRVQS